MIRIITARRAEPTNAAPRKVNLKNRYDFRKAGRSAVVPAAPTKSRIAIRLDKDTLAWFRKRVSAAEGASY